MKKFAIIGAGGFAKEVFCCLQQTMAAKGMAGNAYQVDFVVDDNYYTEGLILGCNVYKLSEYQFETNECFIAIADAPVRKKISERFSQLNYGILIHPSASVGMNVSLKPGTIITQNVVLTCDISVGKHAHFNLNTTVGHDTVIGDFFTSAPNVNISGKCHIGNNVYLGTQASVRDQISIADNVVIGMGGVVIKNIDEPGIYTGVPVKKMDSKS